MSDAAIALAIQELVIANRIMAHENVIDDFGHVSVRHPLRADRYFISRSRSPELVTREDIMELTLDDEPVEQNGRPMYKERVIHSAIYKARPDINAAVHHHAKELLPFTISEGAHAKYRPVMHLAAVLGANIPFWDSQDEFGDTNMLIETREQGDSCARALADNTCLLIRGHGANCVGRNLRETVFIAVQMKENAGILLNSLPLGPVVYLTPGEIEMTRNMQLGGNPMTRAWDYRAARAGFRGI